MVRRVIIDSVSGLRITTSSDDLTPNKCLGTAYGVDHSRLSQMLSLPQDMVRMFRLDIFQEGGSSYLKTVESEDCWS